MLLRIILTFLAMVMATGSHAAIKGDVVSELFWSDACAGWCATTYRTPTDLVVVAHNPATGELVTIERSALPEGSVAAETSNRSGTPNPPPGGTGVVHEDIDIFHPDGSPRGVGTFTYTFVGGHLVNVTVTYHWYTIQPK